MKDRIKRLLKMEETADPFPGPFRALPVGSEKWIDLKAEALNALHQELFSPWKKWHIASAKTYLAKEGHMQRFLDYFEQRQMGVDLSFTHGEIFSVTQAKSIIHGKEIVAEGVARRSFDAPDTEMAQRISGGRAIKALYSKVKYLEEKNWLLASIEKAGTEMEKKNLQEQLRLLEKKHKSLVHGRVHLLMG